MKFFPTAFEHFACAACAMVENARFEKLHPWWSGLPTFQSWLTAWPQGKQLTFGAPLQELTQPLVDQSQLGS